MTIDEIYMQRCLQLAAQAEGHTAPNPMVGAVLVCNGHIVGEGWHHRCGGPHAEMNAITNVADEALLRQSTLYVNLEPCSHYGKTPPCAELIVSKGIPRVVVGMIDPHDRVAGRGISRLRDAGIDVCLSVLETECRYLNRRFVTFHTQHRPYVLLKWAQTADGFIDRLRTSVDTPPLKISNALTKTLNHQMRTHETAILVGTNTALLDNPHLTVTKWTGPTPVRLLVDRSLRVPCDFRLYNAAAPTIIFTEKNIANHGNIEFQQIDFSKNIVPQILDALYHRNLLSVIVEGGRQLLQAFIDGGWWDECHVETVPLRLGNGICAPHFAALPARRVAYYGDNTMQIFEREPLLPIL